MTANIRNVRHSSLEGCYDCEYHHEEFGWLDFLASPDDPDELGRAIHAAIRRGDHGPVAPAPPPPEPTHDDLVAAERQRIREDYIKSPTATDAERIRALEIIMGLREPEIEEGGSKFPPMRD